MNVELVLFGAFALLTLLSAGLVIFAKSPISSAMSLVATFFFLAGIYVLLWAHTVAVLQVLVYAGAIMVLFLFVIMLLDLRNEELAVMSAPRFRWVGLGAAGAFVVLAGALIWNTGDETFWRGAGGPDGGPGAIADALFNRWILAFEVTGILLLGATLGAVVLTKRRLT